MADYQHTAPSNQPVTVPDVKSHLNITISDDDTLLDSYIEAATRLLEDRHQRCFIHQTRTLTMHGWEDPRYVHDRTIYPPRSPLSSVTSIKYIDPTDGTTSTLGSSAYDVSTGDKPGRISEAYNETWPAVRDQSDNITITYVAGHSTASSDVPAPVKLAIKQLVGHWYRQRETVAEVRMQEIPYGVAAIMGMEGVESYG